MLVIGVIPSLPKNEVFPTRSVANPAVWGTRCAQSGAWTDADVEAFFENRFSGGACPTCGQRYYDVETRATLHHFEAGCVSIPAQNDYWGVYDTYCSAIADVWRNNGMVPQNFRTSYAFTDVVHCKGKGEIGVKKAIRACGAYLGEIVSLFVKNPAPRHAILIIGKNNWKNECFNRTLGVNLSNGEDVVGRYVFQRGEICVENSVFQASVPMQNGTVEVYYNIPAPSCSNRSCCPVTFLGRIIGW